ncbi:hypothetical protein [Brevibacterium epidermidis]|uniref:hypothetical protein n=1 Tax=Brevibacterium epidermidis TaxID=1698 RepID=UPI0035167FBF
MEAIYAAAIVLAFIAFGELVSIWSKARIPSLLAAMLATFIFAKIGVLPETVIDDSLLLQTYTFAESVRPEAAGSPGSAGGTSSRSSAVSPVWDCWSSSANIRHPCTRISGRRPCRWPSSPSSRQPC